MTIFWTKRSKQRFLEIREYIKTEFGDGSQVKFTSKVLNFMDLLAQYPELGTVEVEEKDIYGFQLTKQTRIFYRIHKNHISILTLFDSRQNPSKRPK